MNEHQERHPTGLIPVVKLTRDAIAAMNFSAMQFPGDGAGQPINASSARILVDLYYTMQEIRKRIANQIGGIDRGADIAPQHEAADVLLIQAETMEKNARMFLERYASTHDLWPWFLAVHGIGPVLSAGIIAHLGGRPVPPTVGHWWRYAGLDPSQSWTGKDKLESMWKDQTGDSETRTRIIAGIVGRDPDTVIRDATTDHRTGEIKNLTKASAIKSLARIPFNRPLKTLCWKIGDQFVKLGDKEGAFYANYYRQRKASEMARNERGDRRALAEKTLREKPTHAQRSIYEQGKLPDGRVDLMARRATVKLFLSHLHEIWWRLEHNGNNPPAPFSISIQGHGHYIPPPYEMAHPRSKAAA